MLHVLRVKNFVLIDELELELVPGLNVLSGETGAGKSIVVGALDLVLGGRASADGVRSGSTEAEVSALFDLDPSRVAESMALSGLVASGVVEAEPRAEIAIRRVVTDAGRSRAYINGRLCTASELSAIAPDLADVASQHESVALTDPATHLGHLDRFAKLDGARARLSERVSALEALVDRIRELRELDQKRGEREAFARFVLQTIDDVAPQPGELDELAGERKRLRHAGKLLEVTRRAASRLDGDEGVIDGLARTAAELRASADLDPSLATLAVTIDGVSAELREVASTCERYAGELDGDPDRLSDVEERLYRIEGLLRQHGPTIDDVLLTRERLAEELERLAGAESLLAEHERELEARLPEVATEARALSAARKKAASALGSAIGHELGELGMGGARVLVEVELASSREARDVLAIDGARLGRSGIDKVEFLISPNKGIDPKPLRKIASGGELSRALLALKRVLAEGGPAGLYVFDEVDAGVGGAVAERIGAAIADVARHHQVLCITHLAPIAAFADAHFVVEKSSKRDVTESRVVRVEGEQKTRELARMLSGATITRATEDAAREMLAAADKAKRAARKESATAPATSPKPGSAKAAEPAPRTPPKPAPKVEKRARR